MDPELESRLAQLARMPVLLVACDYDGTVAPIVDNPMAAAPRHETVIAMRSLADLPQTDVAVISGRSLRDLAALSRFPHEIRLVGSHGTEFEVGFGAHLPPEAVALRDRIGASMAQITSRIAGSYLEHKPASVAFHYRTVAPEVAAVALEQIDHELGSIDGVMLRHGSKVVEIAVVDTNKGAALETIRRQVGASAALFIGDDVTDEDAFATLSGPDVGIKVGDAETVAKYRVSGVEGVTQVLAYLAEVRTQWLIGSGAPPIEAHSLLSDLRTAAIVAPDARISWLCVPRIDSGAVFAELVGGPAAGFFAVGPPQGGRPASQAYEPESMVLTSSWSSLTVTDYLDCSNGLPMLTAGRTNLIRVLSGSGTARVEFAPRLDFGRVPTRLRAVDGGVEVMGTHDPMVLRAPGVEFTIADDGVHNTALADIDVSDGPVALELRCGTANLDFEQTESDRRASTRDFWGGWVQRLDFPTIETDLVRRSALVLRSLVHGPTGAIVAAATTSLPEVLGGVRNWDYRYCWLRDASLTASALVRLGSHTEALAFLDWVVGVLETRGSAERLAPLFSVSGRHLPPEADIAELAGYAGSRPVRIGNAAEGQVQLDVFGPVVDLAASLVERGAPLSMEHWRMVESMVDAVLRRWTDPDHGIWEIRKPPRHHTYTKAMCWFTLDRAAAVAERVSGAARPEWIEVRDEIRADVIANAWKPELDAFSAAYDDTDLDASVLAVGLTGMVGADDPRLAGTVTAVERHLRDGPTVYRYRADDGLPGHEGGFHLMTSWLIDAMLLVGRRGDALSLFDDLCSLAGPTGLLAEEFDPAIDRALGNHPQAYSHLGLINNALNLDGRR